MVLQLNKSCAPEHRCQRHLLSVTICNMLFFNILYVLLKTATTVFFIVAIQIVKGTGEDTVTSIIKCQE